MGGHVSTGLGQKKKVKIFPFSRLLPLPFSVSVQCHSEEVLLERDRPGLFS